MRAAFLLLFLFWSQTIFAQFTYTIDQSVPVVNENNETLALPWAGGLNATQFNTIDLNGDGKDDLAIYDRTANHVITFVQENNQYRYAPEYEIFFPEGILNWMLLRDFNGDGKKDIFTGDNLGIKVYFNTTSSEGPPTWEIFMFFDGFVLRPTLLTDGFTGKINVQLNADDLPAISDMDGDGDLDLLVPKWPSGATLEYHKNYSMERYGTLDSLDFERTPQNPEAWAGLRECHCAEFAFNNQSCDNHGGRTEHTGGKSLLMLDIDNDGDQDLLFSEAECNQLFLLRNEGDDTTPIINSAINFPSGSPVIITSYPAAYYEDVDFDGKKDLIVSPNIFSREFFQTNFSQSVWFYKNTGSTAQPTFIAPNRDFLQGHMIDVGDNAVPAFFDQDGDGDFDLFIGRYSGNFSSSISFYENVGTQESPIFKLVTHDYFGISFLNLINIKPTFADMNGDFKPDLVFTATNPFNGSTQLYYLPNNNSFGANFSATLVAVDFAILSSENICITDVNRDGKNDILLGKSNGSLQYWQNTGAGYSLEDEAYLELSSSVERQSPACAAADFNGDGKMDLVIGDQSGTLTIISNYREASDASEGVQNLIYNPITTTYVSQNLGGRIWPVAAHIFRTDKPEIVVGNILGGLHVLKHTETTTLSMNPTIDVYPNPVAKAEFGRITVKVDQPALVVLLGLLGQEMSVPITLQAFEEYNFQVPHLPSGVYLLYFNINGLPYTRKIAVD